MPDYHALIVGAGFSGIGAAIKLDRAGFSDYLVVEAGDGVGGTWHWNTYPGIAVDIPSFSYQFSFEQSRHWSRTYAPGHELKAYAEHCVDKYGIRSRIRLNTKVLAAEFDDEHSLWRVQTDPGGEITARFLISACGILTVPKLPDIDGVDSFEGVTMHTARWDHTQDLTGKRVGIIGTGASAVQVIPEMAPIVSHLTVFQRTPIWCFPNSTFHCPQPSAGRCGFPAAKPSTGCSARPSWKQRSPSRRTTSRCFRWPSTWSQRDGATCANRSTIRWCASNSPPIRGGVQAARLPQHLSVDVQPGQRAAGHRADRQDHTHCGGHHRRRQPRDRCAGAGDRLQGARHRQHPDLCRHRNWRCVLEPVLGRASAAGL